MMTSQRRTRPRTVALAGVGALSVAMVGATGALPAHASDAHTPAVVVSQMTGPGSLSDTDVRWGVTGTDLGVMWDNGAGEVLTAFGDTFGTWSGPGGGGGDWRSNVLLRSTDRDLSDGMTFDSAVEDTPGHAGEFIPSLKVDGEEMTTIPTGGIEVDGRQYLAFMSVRQWGPPGEWDTNYSRIAYSDDNGETWNSTDGPQWTNTPDGDHPFQMVSLSKRDGYVYLHGTQNGRFGALHVARVPETGILDTSAYEYWDGSTWAAGDGTAAAQIVPPAAAEPSVQYNEYTDSWLMMYLDGDLDVVLRTAPAPEGPWSESQVAASFTDHPGLYGGYMHPWSNGNELYFALSEWDPYNVFLLKVELDGDGAIVNPNLIRDPSFERATSGALPEPWACTGNCGIDTNHAWAYSGSKQAYMRFDTGWVDAHQDVAVEPNTDYTFSGYVVTGGAPGQGFFGVRGSGDGGAVLAEQAFTEVGRYTRHSVTFNSGDNANVQVFVGTHLEGDRWVQIDNLALVEEETPSWELTKTSDPVTGSEVVAGDVVGYTVVADDVSGPIHEATIVDDHGDVLDDARLVAGSVAASSGDVRVSDGALEWAGPLERGVPLTITYEVVVAGDDDRTDSILRNTVTGAAEGAALVDCPECRTSVLTAVEAVTEPPTELPTEPPTGEPSPTAPATDGPESPTSPATEGGEGPRTLPSTGAPGAALALLAGAAALLAATGIAVVRRRAAVR